MSAVTSLAALLASLCLGPRGPGPSSFRGEQDGAPSFYRDIEPIIHEECSLCHRPGGPAPFALSSYADVKRRARQIAEVTSSGYMPPWLPEPGEPKLVGERRLSEPERQTLRAWAAAGAPEGDRDDRVAREMPSRSGFQLGVPDLVVEADRDFTLAPEGRDVYRNFVVPVPVDRLRFVRAIELDPGNAKVVHHARILVDTTGRARELDAMDEAPGYDGMLVDGATFPDGLFLGWSPGKVPVRDDGALSWPLPPSTDLVLQLHMLPSGKPETLRPAVGIFFTDQPPSRRAAVLQLGSRAIDIPPGAEAHVVEDDYVLPAGVEVFGIYPHAHYLCREMDVHARLPDGSRVELLRIDSWDFFWQDEYRYEDPVTLPAGATITMRYVYDNSEANPRNPSRPPRRVVWGPRSTDEMGDVLLMVVPREPSDLDALRRDFRRNELVQEVEGYRFALGDEPTDASVRHELAFALMELGRVEEAVAEWRRAVGIRPELAEAHYNLGGALARLGRREEAVAAYRRAVAARPDYPEAHNNLGVLLQSLGRVEAAAAAYRVAIEAKPDYAFAHHNLGSLLVSMGAVDEAIVELSTAVRLDPDYAEAHYALASALGRKGRFPEEAAHYRRALAARPDYAEALNNLGGVLVTLGETEEAVALLRRALDLRPEYALARMNLAAAFMARKELDAAIAEYRRVVLAEPENVSALAGLAWGLAVHPEDGTRDPSSALALAERARAEAPDDPRVLDALAAAHASSGRFSAAEAEAERALARAVALGQEGLAGELRARLESYRRGEAFRFR